MEDVMKKAFTAISCVLLTTLIIAAIPTDAEAGIYEDTIRLHILANSDSDADQPMKLEVRDMILEKYADKLRTVDSFEPAKEKAAALLSEIEAATTAFLQERGSSFTAKALLCREWYETRNYEDFSLPCGFYTSLKIIIGSGEGQNWWCVMYPPLCLGIATESASCKDTSINYSKEELLLIRNSEYNIKFKALELISALFCKK